MSIIETKHYLNGQLIRPVNADNIGFKLDWTGDAREAELTVDSLILADTETQKAKSIVLNHIAQKGVFEGIPYRVEIGSLSIDYYLDLTDNPVISGDGDLPIEVNIKRRKAADYFIQQADALSFEAINKTNPISTIDIPYLIVKDNQLELLIVLGISTYTLTKALIEAIDETQQAIADFLETLPPVPGNAGDILAAVIRLIARIAYLAAILIALIDLCKQIIELIFPPLRYFKAATMKELLTKGCQKLGYQFESTILNQLDQITILPVPLQEKNFSIFKKLFSLNTGFFTKGYPTARDTISTLGRAFDAAESMFNGKLRIVGSTVFFERRDFWQLQAGLQITRTLNLQASRTNEWRYNLGEAWKRYWIHYRTDLTDLNTVDDIEGNQAEYSTEPDSVTNADLVSIKGLVDIDIPFALATRKDDLTFIEKATLPFATLADAVINFFGGSSSLVASIQGRIGVMQISQQYFNTTKILFCSNNGRQPSNYKDIIGCPALWDGYHFINNVKDNFKRIENSDIPFSTSNFETLLENNYVLDQENNSIEILTFEWINETKQAQIEYAELSQEGFNTKTILING